MTLADFETLVLSQQPASEPWRPVTDYSFEARKAIEGQHPQLILDVFQPKSILDVGCGFKTLVNLLNGTALLNGLSDRFIARGLDVANPAADIRCDITSDNVPGPCIADLVTCREVLEHLTVRQIAKAVRNLCMLSSQYVYGTTRLSSEDDLLRVETSDDLDPTHITLMSKDLLKLLFVLEGFKYRADLAERMDWMKKGRTFVFERAT